MKEMPVRRISEDELRAAARASVRNHHAVTAVLFGSRARGTARALSDWDVCMITDGDHHVDAAVRRKRLEADHGLWGHPKIEIVWLDRSVFDTSVPSGSLQANIVRDGRVLAGDTTMARARVAPFEAAAVQRNIGRAGNRLHQAIVAAGLTGGNTRGVLPEEERIDMVGDSIAGAEALGRALCALTGTEHTGDHRIGKAGRQIGDRACEGALPVDKKLMDRISRKVQELNDSAQTVRKIEYGAPGEPEEKTVRRFVHALEADLWLRQGLLSGEGPWGGLKDHPRREELVEEVAAKTRHHAGKNRLHWNEARSAVASPELARAIGEWVRGLEELVRKGRLGELPEQGEDAKRRSEAAEIHECEDEARQSSRTSERVPQPDRIRTDQRSGAGRAACSGQERSGGRDVSVSEGTTGGVRDSQVRTRAAAGARRSREAGGDTEREGGGTRGGAEMGGNTHTAGRRRRAAGKTDGGARPMSRDSRERADRENRGSRDESEATDRRSEGELGATAASEPGHCSPSPRAHQRAVASNPNVCSGAAVSLSRRVALKPKARSGVLAASGVHRQPRV